MLEISLCSETLSLPKRTVPLPVAKMQEKVIAERNAVLKKTKNKNRPLEFLQETGFKECKEEGAWLTKERTTLCTEVPNKYIYRVKNNF